MARIYQNERVIMREVGLIKQATITSIIREDLEGTEKELIEKCKKIQKLPGVISVIGEYK